MSSILPCRYQLKKERKPYKYSNQAFYESFFSLYRYLASGQSALPHLPDSTDKLCPLCAAIKKAMIERIFARAKLETRASEKWNLPLFQGALSAFNTLLELFMCLNSPARVLITKFLIGFHFV